MPLPLAPGESHQWLYPASLEHCFLGPSSPDMFALESSAFPKTNVQDIADFRAQPKQYHVFNAGAMDFAAANCLVKAPFPSDHPSYGDHTVAWHDQVCRLFVA